MSKYELPGQTKMLDPGAADTDALICFYSTLHQQRPESEMASRWLLQVTLGLELGTRWRRAGWTK